MKINKKYLPSPFQIVAMIFIAGWSGVMYDKPVPDWAGSYLSWAGGFASVIAFWISFVSVVVLMVIAAVGLLRYENWLKRP